MNSLKPPPKPNSGLCGFISTKKKKNGLDNAFANILNVTIPSILTFVLYNCSLQPLYVLSTNRLQNSNLIANSFADQVL